MVTALILLGLIAIGLSQLFPKPESAYERARKTYRRNANRPSGISYRNARAEDLHAYIRESHPHFQNAIKPGDYAKEGRKSPETVAEEQTRWKSSNMDQWTMELLKSLEWKRYEELCVQYLVEQGCRAEVTPLGADGGIDIKIFGNHGDKPIAVAQCKAWGHKNIKVDLVRALYGVMAAEQIPHGIFLTTTDFTKEAKDFAKGKHLQLISASEFLDLIKKLPDDKQKRLLDFATSGDYTTPTCTRCGTKMVLRKSKKDGSTFWGCRSYPRCRITINLRH
jgi:restriction system protein